MFQIFRRKSQGEQLSIGSGDQFSFRSLVRWFVRGPQRVITFRRLPYQKTLMALLQAARAWRACWDGWMTG